ncbi:MAG: PfkB family carbohydrate kinase [Myxococcota bacterium]|nr:PfkB family carbohydrate kinase [Myxococcota bacterium]
MSARLDRARLERLLDRFSRLRVLVVGDVMLDEYLWGDVDRINPEAPVPVVRVHDDSVELGGAGNVVRNVVAMGAECAFVSVVGKDEAGDHVIALLEDLGVASEGILRAPERPTTRKTRIEARSQQLLRYDRETTEPVAREVARGMARAIDAALPGCHGVILEDYDKGVLPPAVVRDAIKRCNAAEVPVAVDPKQSVAPYKGASLFKPNQREVELLSGQAVDGDAALSRAVARIQRALPGADLVVTRGAEGMSLYEAGAPEPTAVPIARSEVFDIQGAGDTVIAALSLGRWAGGSLLEAAVLATAAAGVVVGKVGTATATPEEIRALLPAAVDAVRASGRRQGRGPSAKEAVR